MCDMRVILSKRVPSASRDGRETLPSVHSPRSQPGRVIARAIANSLSSGLGEKAQLEQNLEATKANANVFSTLAKGSARTLP